MSARITINIGFYFEKEHYAQLNGYIPRRQALEIPQLQILERQRQMCLQQQRPVEVIKGGRAIKSQSKKQSQDDMEDDEDDDNNQDIILPNENQMQIQQDGQGEEIDAEQQIEVDRALEQLQENNYDSDQLSDDQDQIDLSDLSNGSPLKGFNNTKTKRQKGETRDLIQLPDRRPRKDKKIDQATEIIRRQQKQRKRKQYLKKQVQAQQKATLQKILNQTGRKLRLRQQKEMKEENERQHKVFKSLGIMPKIITIINDAGKQIYLSNSQLFPEYMTKTHDIKMKQICNNCGNTSKYKLKDGNKFACSLPCYKSIATN